MMSVLKARSESSRADKATRAPSALHYRLRMTQPDFARDSSLPRRLGLWSAIAVLVGTTIGSGIFRSPAGIADKLPGPFPFLSIWVVGGVFALCGALTLAEVAGAFPLTAESTSSFASRGPSPAFLSVAELIIIRPRARRISTTFSGYFLRVLAYDPPRSVRLLPPSRWREPRCGVQLCRMKWGRSYKTHSLEKKGRTALLIVSRARNRCRDWVHLHLALQRKLPLLAVRWAGAVLWIYEWWVDVTSSPRGEGSRRICRASFYGLHHHRLSAGERLLSLVLSVRNFGTPARGSRRRRQAGVPPFAFGRLRDDSTFVRSTAR